MASLVVRARPALARLSAVSRSTGSTPLLARALSSQADVAAFMASSPASLAGLMKAKGIRRAYVVTEPAKDGAADGARAVVASDPAVAPLAEFLGHDTLDYQQHDGLFLELGRETGALMGAFLWWTHRGQGCGGIRLREFDTVEAFIRDGLRLATGMGRKSALAGLWWGGGKGVIAQQPGDAFKDREYRDKLFTDYGQFLTSLRGCYVAAEDSGVNVDDVDVVYHASRYTTCISPHLGGSGNPSIPTAAGVVAAMEGALDYKGMGTLEGKSIAVQGVGNVGLPLIEFLLERGVKRIVASESSANRFHIARALMTPDDRVDMRLSELGDNSILAEDVDIVAPCAWGAVLSVTTIPTIKAGIVCGAANNQLATPEDDGRLAEAGVTYVPDFVANRMGIVSCANEQYGRVGSLASMADPSITRHLGREWENSVFNITRAVLERAASAGKTPGDAANELADEAARVPHPIWGGSRPADIIQGLIRDEWAADRW